MFEFVRLLLMYNHLNTVGDHPLIPEQAFLFIPFDSKSPHTSDDFKIGEAKNIRRLLFQGWADQTYTPFEKEKLNDFQQYLTRKNITLDPRWNLSWKLRFLQSTGFDNKKTIKDMGVFIEYQDKVKNLQMSVVASKNLKEGIFYFAGRDSHYRPILVFDIKKFIDLELTEEDIIESQIYFFEYVLRNLLIPGQVENWVAIIDVGEQGLFSVMGAAKTAITFLSNTYRSRMFVCYVVRCPSSIYFLWGIAKKFMEEETIRKINFFDGLLIQPLLEFCHKSQLEVKFGGTRPNVEPNHFWPPKNHSSEYRCDKEKTHLITRQEYTHYYTDSILYETKFHQELLVKKMKKEEEDLTDNANLHILKKLEREFKMSMEICNDEEALEIEINEKISEGVGETPSFQKLLPNLTLKPLTLK